MSNSPNGPTYLYVLECAGHVKIGIAAAPDVRMANLQLASPVKIELRHERLFQTRDAARLAERSLHAKFAAVRSWGEWFALGVDEAVAAAIAAEEQELPVRIPAPPRELPQSLMVLGRKAPAPKVREPVIVDDDGPTFEEMEAMPGDIWTEFMRPCAATLDFGLDEDARQMQVDTLNASLRQRYPQYFGRRHPLLTN